MRRIPVFASLVLLAAALCGCRQAPAPTEQPAQPAPPRPVSAFPMTVKDARGVEVTFDKAPQRIVSMSPPITETLFALGLGDRIVGVTRFCQFPEEAKTKEQIGGVSDPSTEKVVSLAPDVVFVTVGNPLPVMEALQKVNIRVFSVDPKSYDGVCEAVATLGRICGVPQAGEKLSGQMLATAHDIAAKVAGIPQDKRPSALLVVWLDPLFVAGPGTYMDDMLKVCGARNAAGETKNPWKEFSLEMAVAADPEVLVLMTEHTPGAKDEQQMLDKLRANPSWQGVRAVKNGCVRLIHSDLIARTGPRLEEALKRLSQAIHPEIFGEPSEAPTHNATH
jgi:iron complex transport system substrate-binding protein